MSSFFREWELHFGLLYSAYQRTNDENTKATIRFLISNYLAKAAFLNPMVRSVGDLSEEDHTKYENMLQLGLYTMGGLYHRGVNRSVDLVEILKLTDKIGSPNEEALDLIPLDTMEVTDLYKVSFAPILDLTKPDEIIEILMTQFELHLDQFLNENMPFPVLIDITPQIGPSLITDNDPVKIKEYENKQKEVRAQINKIIDQVVEKIKDKYQEKDANTIADYIRTNLAVVSRAYINNHLAILGLHKNIFDRADFKLKDTAQRERHFFITEKVKEWSIACATVIGAVNMRRLVSEVSTDIEELAKRSLGAQAVDYSVPGKTDLILYKTPTDILNSNLFKMLVEIGEGEKHEFGPAQQLLVQATVKMVQTLLSRISEKDWSEKQKNPALNELIQTTFLRVSQHLAKAISKPDNFREFSQGVDRAHSELVTLLALFTPFNPSSFDDAHRTFLNPLFPQGMQPASVGIARAAMNVFAGANAAVIQNNPHPIRICGAHSYYEEVELVGETLTLDQALQDPNIQKIDLYVAEFYHNIDIDANHVNYQKGTVIEDIKRIFKEKPLTDALTVTLDATIDFTRSDDVKALLDTFQEEIKKGRLNLVIFRSGQKFDMLGLDHYFGAPFYIVNNGDPKWDEFKKIKTEVAFKTDPLSEQFFTWMAETGPQLVDRYKQQIFANTRAILDLVPSNLKPAPGKDVCVCSFETDVKTPFIDIKINLKDPRKKDDLVIWASTCFLKLFIDEGRLVYARGSFGFPHPNITWIDPKLRINPGLDPTDNQLFEKFFQELEAKVKELESQ